MTTIKSYTDLLQSKKLAEILPLESADMCYRIVSYNPDDTHVYQPYCFVGTLQSDVPCWSLAALFNVMPQINKWFTPYGHKDDKLFQFDPKICKMGEHSIIPSYKVTYSVKLFTDIYDNPVDACYEMILKLHELKML